MKIWRLNRTNYEKLARKFHALGRLDSSNLSSHPDYKIREQENKEIFEDFATFNLNKMPKNIQYWTKFGAVLFIIK